MPEPRIRGRAAALLPLAALTAALLAGCAGNPVQDLVDRTVEDAVEGATGGDVELSGDLPADFPESVPVIDGTIELAGGTGSSAEGWVVVLSSPSSDPLADATTALTGAGFTQDATLSGESAGGSVYTDGEYLVVLAGDETTVTYTVMPAPR
ncbi:hypothetical protein ACFPER_17695 [Agromyces aurantiacus]|uniref:Secreted protein n=1 Tax=Agromyces aurantiacus TaxID=165814 RepID=A0ABV9RB43_9MICO|nr:hypothetical protein [Agromyces aurantiacus]MBM7505323.1 hypothetical protein [Agromyces aurantiacus]